MCTLTIEKQGWGEPGKYHVMVADIGGLPPFANWNNVRFKMLGESKC